MLTKNAAAGLCIVYIAHGVVFFLARDFMAEGVGAPGKDVGTHITHASKIDRTNFLILMIWEKA